MAVLPRARDHRQGDRGKRNVLRRADTVFEGDARRSVRRGGGDARGHVDRAVPHAARHARGASRRGEGMINVSFVGCGGMAASVMFCGVLKLYLKVTPVEAFAVVAATLGGMSIALYLTRHVTRERRPDGEKA